MLSNERGEPESASAAQVFRKLDKEPFADDRIQLLF